MDPRMTAILFLLLCSLAASQIFAADQPSETLPPKIHQIQESLPIWIQRTGRAKAAISQMKKLDEQIKANEFEEAEKIADEILKMIGDVKPLTEEEKFNEACKMLRHQLSGTFIVSRDSVQEELHVTSDQKAKLDQFLKQLIPEAQKFFQSTESLKKSDQQERRNQFRHQTYQKLDPVLHNTLSDEQRIRLRQLVFQREGLLADSQPVDELHITQEQREQFMASVQQAEKQIEPLIKEAEAIGSPEDIRPKVMKIHTDLKARLETYLSDSQAKQWKEMRGKTFPVESLFDN